MRRLPPLCRVFVCVFLSAIACECDLDLCHFDVDKLLFNLASMKMFFCVCQKVAVSSETQQKFVRIEASLAFMACSPHDVSPKTRFRTRLDRCMFFRPIEDGRVAITAVVHVDDIFAAVRKERCDRLCVDLNRAIPVKNLGELKWYGGCRYSRDRERGTLTIPQQSFAEELVKKFGLTSVQNVPLRVGLKLEEFDDEETDRSITSRRGPESDYGL